MKHYRLFGIMALLLLGACTTSTYSSVSQDLPARPSAAPSGSLSSLLTGQVVSSEEQQLRDIKTRQILLDFPIKIGVVFYNLQSRLEETDLTWQYEDVAKGLKASGLVKETLRIPNALISNAVTIEELRRLGARFQCDLLVLVTGSHTFETSRNQNLSFLDSFSYKANYDSKIKFEAITLDVFTGTLLNPFDAVVQGGPFLLDRATPDFGQQRYKVEKDTETKAWEQLKTEALTNLQQLKADVAARKASLTASPVPGTSASPVSATGPTSSPAASPTTTPIPAATGAPR